MSGIYFLPVCDFVCDSVKAVFQRGKYFYYKEFHFIRVFFFYVLYFLCLIEEIRSHRFCSVFSFRSFIVLSLGLWSFWTHFCVWYTVLHYFWDPVFLISYSVFQSLFADILFLRWMNERKSSTLLMLYYLDKEDMVSIL